MKNMREENNKERKQKESINESMRNFLSTSKDKRAEIWEKFVGSGIRGWRRERETGVTIVFNALQRTYTIRSVRTQIRWKWRASCISNIKDKTACVPLWKRYVSLRQALLSLSAINMQMWGTLTYEFLEGERKRCLKEMEVESMRGGIKRSGRMDA